MFSGRRRGIFVLTLIAAVIGALFFSARSNAQAALLMEEPYGLYGMVNPTGHTAIYLEHVCAETPLKVRRCRPGEPGAVVSRYEGMGGFDWIAMPLVPYLYSVENVKQVPPDVDHDMVTGLRDHYREAHFESLSPNEPWGSITNGRWPLLVGEAYERRIYAFRFDTTQKQDDAVIAWLNSDVNQTHFNMLFRNCADFARTVLNIYFPHTFRRSIFPDAGVTTPKQVTYKLVRYAHKHPQKTHLTVFEIPQIPGYRHRSHSTKDISESLSTTLYALPITFVNPYLFGGIFVDYLVRGRYHLVPKNPQMVAPDDLQVLTQSREPQQNAASAGMHAAGAVPGLSLTIQNAMGAHSGLQEIKATNE